jgi:hypothetical protein
MFFICKSLNKSGEEKETVPPEFVSQISNPCGSSWHSWVKCSHSSTCTFLPLPKHNDTLTYICLRTAQLVTPDSKPLLFFAYWVYENHFSFSKPVINFSGLIRYFSVDIKMQKSQYIKESVSFHCVSPKEHKELVLTNSLSVRLFGHDQCEQHVHFTAEVSDVQKTEILYWPFCISCILFSMSLWGEMSS